MSTPGDKTQGRATDTGEWARNPRQTQVPAQDRRTVQPGQNQNQTQNQNQNQTQNQFQNQVQQPGTSNADTTHANSYVPRPVMPPAAQGDYQFGPTGQPGGNFGGNNTYNGFGPGTGGFGPGSGTGAGTGAGPGTGYRPNTGPGTGYRPGAGTGAGPNQPGTRGPGAGSGARLPEERLPGANPARGATGAKGANGMPMGNQAGGRGKNDDKEKKAAPYLRNPDPDATFGGFTEKPMPPVIGEKK
jgi:hypothetical protein